MGHGTFKIPGTSCGCGGGGSCGCSGGGGCGCGGSCGGGGSGPWDPPGMAALNPVSVRSSWTPPGMSSGEPAVMPPGMSVAELTHAALTGGGSNYMPVMFHVPGSQPFWPGSPGGCGCGGSGGCGSGGGCGCGGSCGSGGVVGAASTWMPPGASPGASSYTPAGVTTGAVMPGVSPSSGTNPRVMFTVPGSEPDPTAPPAGDTRWVDTRGAAAPSSRRAVAPSIRAIGSSRARTWLGSATGPSAGIVRQESGAIGAASGRKCKASSNSSRPKSGSAVMIRKGARVRPKTYCAAEYWIALKLTDDGHCAPGEVAATARAFMEAAKRWSGRCPCLDKGNANVAWLTHGCEVDFGVFFCPDPHGLSDARSPKCDGRDPIELFVFCETGALSEQLLATTERLPIIPVGLGFLASPPFSVPKVNVPGIEGTLDGAGAGRPLVGETKVSMATAYSHEFGHVLGLGHVSEKEGGSMMAPRPVRSTPSLCERCAAIRGIHHSPGYTHAPWKWCGPRCCPPGTEPLDDQWAFYAPSGQGFDGRHPGGGRTPRLGRATVGRMSADGEPLGFSRPPAS